MILHSRENYELVMRRLRAPREILLSKAIEDVAVVLINAAVVREIGYEPPKNPRVPLPEAGIDYGREPAKYLSPPLAGGVNDGTRGVTGENQKQKPSTGGGDGGTVPKAIKGRAMVILVKPNDRKSSPVRIKAVECLGTCPRHGGLG